jgi:hypothetical protein
LTDRIKDIWEELKKNKVKDDSSPFIKRAYNKFNSDDPVYFMVAKSLLSNECGILIQASANNIPKDYEKPLSENLKLEEYKSKSEEYYLWFYLKKDTIYEDLFEVICADLIKKAISATNPKSSIISFINGIKDWQEFLKQKKNYLTEGAVKGLYAELSFINNFLIKKCEIKEPIRCWKPYENTHDFLINDISVEIKSTTSSPIKKIKINSLKQLDETLTDSLYLNLVQLNENSGETLNDIVDKIRNYLRKISFESYYLFESKLLQEGYLNQHREVYSKKKFSISENFYFSITKDFPRIRDLDLKNININGILDAKYEIDFMSFEKHKIIENKLINIIKKLS